MTKSLNSGRTRRNWPKNTEVYLTTRPDAKPPYSYRIEGLKIKSCMIKVRKISCKSLKNRGVQSGLRLIYAYFKEESRIVFVELYHKSDKPGEDRARILKYFK